MYCDNIKFMEFLCKQHVGIASLFMADSFAGKLASFAVGETLN